MHFTKMGKGMEGMPLQDTLWSKEYLILIQFSIGSAAVKLRETNLVIAATHTYGQGDHAALECPLRSTKVATKD